jgi:hypothetical protein
MVIRRRVTFKIIPESKVTDASVKTYLTIRLSEDSMAEPRDVGGVSLTFFLIELSGAEAAFAAIIPPIGIPPSCMQLCAEGEEGVQSLKPGNTPTPPPILATRQTSNRI